MPRQAVRDADRPAGGSGATDRRATDAVGLPRLGRLAWCWGGGCGRRGRLVHHVDGRLHHRQGHAVDGGCSPRAGRAERRDHGHAGATSYRSRDAGAVDGGAAAPPVLAAAAVSPVATLCAAAAFSAAASGARLVGPTSPARECGRRRGARPRGHGRGQHPRVVGRDGPVDSVDGTAPSIDGRHVVVWPAPSARGGGGAARILPPLVTAADPPGAPVACGVGDGDAPAARHYERRAPRRHGGRVATNAVARRRPWYGFLCGERADRRAGGVEWCGVTAAHARRRAGGGAARGRRGGDRPGAQCGRRCRGGRWSWREAAGRAGR